MNIDIVDGRAIIAPFTAANDINPQTGKAGIRVHNAIIGFILELIGKAEKVYDDKHKEYVYLNHNSAHKWAQRHGVTNQHYDPVFWGSGWLVSLDLGDIARMEESKIKVQQDGQDHKSWYTLGQYHRSFHQHTEAAEAYKQAADLVEDDISLENSYFKYLFHHAEECEEMNTAAARQEAIDSYTKIIDRNGADYVNTRFSRDPLLQRADLYALTGQKNAAIADYEEVLRQNPDNNFAKLGLRRCKPVRG